MKNSNFVFLTIFFWFSISTQAQENKDALWSMWNDKTLTATTRLEAMNGMYYNQYGYSINKNPDTTILHAQLAYDLAEENNLKLWMAKALVTKGTGYYRKGDFENAVISYTESKNIAKRNNYFEIIGNTSYNLGNIFLKQSLFQKALDEFDEALSVFETLADNRKIATVYDGFSQCYFRQQNTEQCLLYLNKALVIREELIKENENDRDRFVINGMKQTIAMLKSRYNGSVDSTGVKSALPKEDVQKEGIPKEPNEQTKNEKPNEKVENEKSDEIIEYTSKKIEQTRESGDQRELAEALILGGSVEKSAGNYENSINNYLEALTIYQQLGNKFEVAKTLENIGISYHAQAKYAKSIEYCLKAIEMNKAMGFQNNMSNLFYIISNSYRMQGNINLALDYLNRNKEAHQKSGDKVGLTQVQNILATIYKEQKDYPKALEIYNENLANFTEAGDKLSIAGTLSNIAVIYQDQHQNAEALEKYLIAYNAFKEIGDESSLAGVAAQISKLYLKEKNYKEALEYANQSIVISQNINNKINLALGLETISKIYYSQRNYNAAISTGNKALAIAQEHGHLSLTSAITKNLADSYKASGQYKAALEFNELYFETRDSLNNTENQKAFIRQQFQADYEKQKALDDLENEKLLSIETQKKENQQKLTAAIGFGSFIIFLFAIGLFNRLRLTRKQKAIIEEQKKKVEQSEKYKEQFLANMSHEIRTPMHAISGMLKIIKRNTHPKTQDPYLKAMEVSTENLIVILNDVLDMSKIEAGKLDIENISINPASIIEDVQQILKYKAEEKALDIKINIGKDVPTFVKGDPTRLNQILLNLAGNAIKFTDKGLIEIALEKKYQKLVYTVRDTGIGISPDGIEQIFAPFIQAQRNTSKFYGGTGLGLSITKQLVELQNGKIWAESEPGKGSTFFVEFPLIIASEELENQSNISRENLKMMANSLKGISILLAEDNPFNQMIARDDLEYYFEDVQIDIAENGKEAIEKYKTKNYDIILMDVQMPLMNGFETTTFIREIEKTDKKDKTIRIVAMTASLLKTEVDKCYQAGMNDYIPKPYKASELVGTIYKALKA